MSLRLIALSFTGSIFLLAPGCSRPASVSTTESKTVAPVRVMTVSVTSQPVNRSTTQPATVHAFFKTEIRPRVAGYLSEVNADIGDVVKKDQVLAVVDVPEMIEQQKVLLASIERKQAEEAAATAGIQLAKAGVASAEAQLEQAKSELQSVDASLAAADAEFQRTQDLVDRRSVEPRLLDEARKKRDSEVARKAAVTSAIGSAKAAVTVAKAGQAAAEAELKAAIAETKIATQQLSEMNVMMRYAKISAPFAGIITARHAEPGSLVDDQNHAMALFEISQVDVVRVRVSVPEREAAFVNPGDSISVTFPSFTNELAMDAQVTRTSGSLNPSTRMMLIEAEIKNQDGKLIPGMFGQAAIDLDSKTDVAVLPARAVRFTETGDPFVYALTGDTVSVVNVTTGSDDGNTIEIVSGVAAGQTVVDAHLQRFSDGQQVDVLGPSSGNN